MLLEEYCMSCTKSGNVVVHIHMPCDFSLRDNNLLESAAKWTHQNCADLPRGLLHLMLSKNIPWRAEQIIKRQRALT